MAIESIVLSVELLLSVIMFSMICYISVNIGKIENKIFLKMSVFVFVLLAIICISLLLLLVFRLKY